MAAAQPLPARSPRESGRRQDGGRGGAARNLGPPCGGPRPQRRASGMCGSASGSKGEIPRPRAPPLREPGSRAAPGRSHCPVSPASRTPRSIPAGPALGPTDGILGTRTWAVSRSRVTVFKHVTRFSSFDQFNFH